MRREKELAEFLEVLKNNRKNLTAQQFRTIKGQAISGDVFGAKKGLLKLLERRFR